MNVKNWRPGDPVTQYAAHRALHILWSETEYPPGKKTEHKRLWQLLNKFVESQK